jgi:predicted secreted hydrolase
VTTLVNRRVVLFSAALGGALSRAGNLLAEDAVAPKPVAFPDDEGVHRDSLTEWWYYTGHLVTDDGDEYGFEDVFFRASRDGLRGWAAHCALTDKGEPGFRYDQRIIVGEADGDLAAPGMDFRIDDWLIAGLDGEDRIVGSVDGASWRLRLSSTKPPVLHGGDGYTRGSNDETSYYYSRTRYAVEGTLIRDDVPVAVTGEGWMDHQWGDFTSFSEGGWDWFALQLDDRTELMAYYVRDDADVQRLASGTFVEADGSYRELPADAFTIAATGSWTSPDSGGTYPMGWTLSYPERDLELTIDPILEAQELDTRDTTMVTYWEGAVTVAGTLSGRAIAGKGYVEMTGYARDRDGVVP